jgi:NADH-quinone oxidoreductase subunit H
MWGFSVFGSVVFLGGWQYPRGGDWGWGWQLALTLIKSFAWILAIIWIRATVPRLRVDQLMSFCWKVLLPLSLVQLLANAFVLEYDGPYVLLTLTSGAGAVALIALIIFRTVRRPKSKLVGAYRTAQVPVP